MRARSILFLVVALGSTSCYGDDSQPLTVEVQDMSERVTSVLVDDSLGIACMKHSVTEQNGHNPQTVTYTGGCMAVSDIPALAAKTSLRETFDVTQYADDIIIDDDNAIVCLKLSSQFKGCIAQSKLDPNGLDSLRKLAQ